MKRKIRKAAALTYSPETGAAPKVVAAGKGHVAEEIIRLAKKNDVYVHEDSDLAEILSALDSGSEIPESVYRAVAKLLLFVYSLNGKEL